MNAYIDMYNQVLFKIKTIRKQLNKQHNKVFKYNEINFNLNLNKLKVEFVNYKDKLSTQTQINKHILDYAIQDALNAFESVKTNLDKDNIKKSRLRYLKKSKPNKIIKIEKQITSNDGFCTSILGKVLKSKPNINFKNATEQVGILKYNSKTDKFTFHLKYSIDYIKEKPINKIGCFDIGLRTFFTGISNDYTIEYGFQINNHIRKVLEKMDRIKRKKMVKNKNEYMVRNGISKNKLIRNKKKHLLKYENYLSNYINNVHWQIANDMTKRFDYIILGNFSTKNMVETDSTSKMNKKIGNALKLYQFKQKLKYKCIIRGCKYKVVNEYMTTQCCSNCSRVNPEIKEKKVFECSECGHIYDRDINSSKNIFMKSLKYNLDK
jgi:IS605 OrfB family transposase